MKTFPKVIGKIYFKSFQENLFQKFSTNFLPKILLNFVAIFLVIFQFFSPKSICLKKIQNSHRKFKAKKFNTALQKNFPIRFSSAEYFFPHFSHPQPTQLFFHQTLSLGIESRECIESE